MHAWRACLLGCGILLVGNVVSRAEESSLTISSPDFAQGQPLPKSCALHGDNRSPQLKIQGVPAAAKSLVLIMDDPDAPAGLWTHWLVWNIRPEVKTMARGGLPAGAVQGKNSFGDVGYDGPAPPSGTHRYFFHLSALDEELSLPSGASRDELVAAMKGHVVGSAEFYGTYSASP